MAATFPTGVGYSGPATPATAGVSVGGLPSMAFDSERDRLEREQLLARNEERRRNAEEERRMYEAQIAGLRGLQTGGEARMAAARAPQEAAVDVLGQRAQTLEGGAALMANQQAREAAQARAMQSPGAILGGQIGAMQAGAMGALEQEAAARQAAYLRGVQQMGAGMMTEAEQRRLTEAELIKDMQLRFAAAQQIAAANEARREAQKQQERGMFASAGGAILGGLVGGPAGAAAGAKLGGSIGGGTR